MTKEREEVVVNENGERVIYRDRPKKRNPFLLGCMGLIGLLILLGACGAIFGLGDDTEKKEETKTEEVAIEEDVTTEKATEEEVTTETKKDEPTREQKAALASAKNYSELMHMSKQGLYDQLTSSAGDKFPADAAQYAIDNLKADYKKNALESAKNYAEMMNMSTDAIYDQLTSEAGDKFTPEEAQYAVDNLDK